MSEEAKKKFGSFRIQKMSNPYGEWLWSLRDEGDIPTGLSKGGYKSAEDAARYVCQLIRYVGGDTENVEIRYLYPSCIPDIVNTTASLGWVYRTEEEAKEGAKSGNLARQQAEIRLRRANPRKFKLGEANHYGTWVFPEEGEECFMSSSEDYRIKRLPDYRYFDSVAEARAFYEEHDADLRLVNDITE